MDDKTKESFWSKKTPPKGNTPNNYRRITYLLMMWKILTSKIREEIYKLLISCGQFFEEQKECYNGKRGTGDLLYLD